MVTDFKLPVNFEPFGDWVLLEPIPPGQTAGGIALPEGSAMGVPSAKVIAAGPGKMCEYDGKTMPMNVKVGDIVYQMSAVANGSALPYYENGKEYSVIRAHHLIGKVPNHKPSLSGVR